MSTRKIQFSTPSFTILMRLVANAGPSCRPLRLRECTTPRYAILVEPKRLPRAEATLLINQTFFPLPPHPKAYLLPDGRVFVAGSSSNDPVCVTQSVNCTFP